MKWLYAGREALKNVMRNKLRTALTMLGLVIGISSVIVLVGMSDGSNKQVTDQMKALGGDVISAYLFDASLEYADMGALRELPGVGHAAPSKNVSAEVSSGKKRSNRAMVEATDEHYLASRNLELAAGRNLSAVDRENKSKVCLIGTAVAKDLFATTDAIGRTVKLAGDEFTVVGIVKSQGESMGLSTDGIVLVPYQAAHALGANGKIESLCVRAVDESAVQSAKHEIETFLKTVKQIDPYNFTVGTQDEMLNAGGSISKTMTLLLGGVASISLLVAGIGVMNVMLVSVAERVREIGIKKALGARRSDIMVQFLAEALLISLIGGTLGIAFGIGLCEAAAIAGIACSVSPVIVAVAVFASTFIGLAFGILPAYRASRLNPIEALRQE